MKLGVFSDIHIDEYKSYSSVSRLDICLSCLETILEYYYTNEINKILFVGDWFNIHKLVRTKAGVESIRLLKKYDMTDIYGISGNHDFDGRNTLEKPAHTALSILSESCPNFHVIDNKAVKIDSDIKVYGIPYYNNINDVYKHIETLKISDKFYNILLLHQTPYGIENKNIKIDCKVQDFSMFDFVLCGHIHKHQILSDNFVVVGNPLQRDLGDLGQRKGILTLDTDKSNVKFIELDMPKFALPEDAKEGDYIIPQHKAKLTNKSSIQLDSKFNISLPIETLMANYLEHISGDKKYKKVIKELV